MFYSLVISTVSIVSHSVRVRSLPILSTVNNTATTKYWTENWRNLVRVVINNDNLMFRRPKYAASYLTPQLSDCFQGQRSFLIKNVTFRKLAVFSSSVLQDTRL